MDISHRKDFGETVSGKGLKACISWGYSWCYGNTICKQELQTKTFAKEVMDRKDNGIKVPKVKDNEASGTEKERRGKIHAVLVPKSPLYFLN